jgi:hypothetical protein
MQEIVGYRLNSHIDRNMVDGILKNAMPIWNDEDKSVYFIRGHVAGSLVAKMKELQVLDLWFTPIYEDEEIKSDWVKENHLEYYYKEGIMKEEPKQETRKNRLLEELVEDIKNQQSFLKSIRKNPQLYYYKFGTCIYERLYNNNNCFEMQDPYGGQSSKMEQELIELKAEKIYYE